MNEDDIYCLIAQGVDCAFLDVSGDGKHFEALVVSNVFIDKSKIMRHRLVHKALGDKLGYDIHALSMKLYTIEEWEKIK